MYSDSSFLQLAQNAGTPDDSTCVVEFFLKPFLLGKQSLEAGREIYQDRECIRIQVKGQDKQVISRPVREEDILRFPQAYMAFKNQQEVPSIGTPLEQLGGVSPSLIKKIKPLGVKTIEDVAALTEEGLMRLGMGARELQKKCKAYLEQTSMDAIELQEKLEAAETKIEALEAEIEALKKPKPRRKTKKS